MAMHVLRRWAVILAAPVGQARWIYQGTSGSGWRIGMRRTTMHSRHKRILGDRQVVMSGSCGAAPGTVMRGACVVRIAAGTIPPFRTSTSGSGASWSRPQGISTLSTVHWTIVLGVWGQSPQTLEFRVARGLPPDCGPARAIEYSTLKADHNPRFSRNVTQLTQEKVARLEYGQSTF